MSGSALVGRERELESVAAFLEAGLSAAGAMLIQGDAGIGKTALWEHGVASLDGRTVLSCRPAEAESAFSFSGLGDLLGGVIDSVLDELPGPQRDALEVALLKSESAARRDPRAVGAGTLSAFKALAVSGPVVIAVDDLQWLDRPSAKALGFALRRMANERVTLLATRRREPTPSVLMLEAALRDRAMERLELGPLSVGALGRLIDDHLNVRFPRSTMLRIHHISGGNPLHALELARALTGAQTLPAPGQHLPVPEDMQALLLERVGRIPAPTRDALLLSSLLSPPTEDTLARVLGSGWDREVDRLRVSGVVEIVDGVVKFSHPLLASAVAMSAPAGKRREAHRRLADAGADDEQRARHLALATIGADADVARELEHASRLAARRGAPEAAAELAELALNLTPVGTDDICRRRILAGEARFAAGDLAIAEEHFGHAASTAEAGTERAEALSRLGRVQAYHTDVAGSVVVLQEALSEAGDNERLKAQIEHDLAFPSFVMVDLHATLRHARAAAESAERSGATKVLSNALGEAAGAEFLTGAGVQRDAMKLALEHPRRACVP